MPSDNEFEAFITELEELINDSKSPLAGGGTRKIIDAKKAYEILDDIKASLPEELMKARRIMRERNEILEAATAEAEHIVTDAEDRANTLASDQEIVRIAKDQAMEIKRNAEHDASEIRYWASNSADTTFTKIEEELRAVIDKTTALLSQMEYCRSVLNGQDAQEEPYDETGMYYGDAN